VIGRVQRLGFLIAALVVVLDQLTKWYFFQVVDLARVGPIPVLPFFRLAFVSNHGVSFGLFNNGAIWGRIGLTIFALAISGVVGRWLLKADRLWPGAAMGLVIGGALGNVIDRLIYGAVADFFHFYAFGHDWYVFNVADAAITVGVIVLLLDAFVRPEKESVGSR
jgi:signal peptidase II